jgi:amidohydrolase
MDYRKVVGDLKFANANEARLESEERREAMTTPVEFRRDLHRHPELARQEHRTTHAVYDYLKQVGLEPTLLPTGTGLYCDIGEPSGPIVALRADMDALPVPDEKSVSYRSTVADVSHACGHDVHTSILVGVGRKLAAAEDLPGRVRLIFQPAEESPVSGSLDVIAGGALDDVAVIYALHCDPSALSGQMRFRVGGITSAMGMVSIHLKGNGGHSARPNLTRNPIEVAAKLILSLQGVVNSRLLPDEKVLIGFGAARSGDSHNAIPASAEIAGTVRTPDLAVWQRSPELIESSVAEILAPLDLEYNLSYTQVCPLVINDERAVELGKAVALRQLGAENVLEAPQSLGGEDFSWYLQHVPGALFRLGVRRPDDERTIDLHSGLFDVDERCIQVGIDFFCDLVRDSFISWPRV